MPVHTVAHTVTTIDDIDSLTRAGDTRNNATTISDIKIFMISELCKISKRGQITCDTTWKRKTGN